MKQSKGELNINIEILKFNGGLAAEEFIDWLYTIEKIFYYEGISDDKKIKLIAIRLKSRATAWWEQLKVSGERKEKAKVLQLSHLRENEEKMKENFLPLYHVQTLYKRLPFLFLC